MELGLNGPVPASRPRDDPAVEALALFGKLVPLGERVPIAGFADSPDSIGTND